MFKYNQCTQLTQSAVTTMCMHINFLLSIKTHRVAVRIMIVLSSCYNSKSSVTEE